MSRRIVPLLLVLTAAACGGDGPTPPITARCDVSVSETSANPPSTEPSPPAGSPFHALVEPFSGPSINTQRWSPYDASTTARTTHDDRLTIDVAAGTASYSGLVYRLPHSINGSAFLAEISRFASGGANVETVVGLTSDDEEEYVLMTSFGTNFQLVYYWRDGVCNDPSHERTAFGYTYCMAGSIMHNAVDHRFRRIREAGGTLHVEVSADGGTWTQPTGWSLQHRFDDPASLHGLLAAGSPTPYPVTGPAVFENANTVVPALPRDIAASCPSDSAVRLTWDRRSVNETGFRIERRVGGGAFSEVGTVAPGTMEFRDDDTRAGSTYTYRVRAFNDAGSGGTSRTVTVAR
jgi:hypothetical protein